MEKWTKEELDKMLDVIKSDLQHQIPERREINNKNIQRELFMTVIRELYSERGFLLHEKEDDGTGRVGCYIKGYVRDVWDYLDSAYDLIHDTEYINKKQ